MTRTDRFDELVAAALRRLEIKWGRRLSRIQVAVEDVPPSNRPSWETGIPLAMSFPAADALPQRIVIYRRPIQFRASDLNQTGLLVLNVLVEQLAHLWRIPPETIDPGYGRNG
jgi:predicted Zn-dependent protease with MMP-like domain